jgi:outer membrane autotransporter protein
MVVQAINGATSESGAFALDGPVAAGAFEYYLFKGGVTAGTEDNWYLRSTLVALPAPEPTPDDPDPVAPPPPEVAPAPGATDPLPPEATPVEVPPEVAPPPPPPVDPAPPPPPEATPVDPDPVDPAPPVEVDDPAPDTPPPAPPAEPADPPPPPPTPPTEPAEVPVPTSPPPLPTPENPDPVPPPPPVQPAPPTPGATPVEASEIPLYRIEVPTYAVVPPAATYMMDSMLGTFHERRGEQSLLDGSGYLPASWGRIFGQDAEMKWGGTVAPSFNGDLVGFQAGTDLIGWEGPSGHQNRAGLFIGHTSMDGDVRGQALGWNNLLVGKLDLDGTSFGGYWTHIGPGGWYLDGVVMGTWFDGDATSSRRVGIDLGGTGVTASLEGGYPIALDDQWTLEPQAQLIWQHLSLDDQTDRFSTVSFDTDDTVTGRLGLRLQGALPFGGGVLQPYLKANIWHDFDATDSVSFGGDPILTDRESTSFEFGGGVVAKLSDTWSVFATADYTTNLGGDKRRVFEGNLGLNIKW